MADAPAVAAAIPRDLSTYPDLTGAPLTTILSTRAEIEPFNVIATGIFVLAILHTFAAARFIGRRRRIACR